MDYPEDIVDRIASSQSTDPLLREASIEIVYLREELARAMADRYKIHGDAFD